MEDDQIDLVWIPSGDRIVVRDLVNMMMATSRFLLTKQNYQK
jgi:hypothetical protein